MDDILGHIFCAKQASLCRRRRRPTVTVPVPSTVVALSPSRRAHLCVPSPDPEFRAFDRRTGKASCAASCVNLPFSYADDFTVPSVHLPLARLPAFCSAPLTPPHCGRTDTTHELDIFPGWTAAAASEPTTAREGTIQLSAAIGAGASPSRARARRPAANANDHIGCVE